MRADFVKKFGAEEAEHIEAAAHEHANGINSLNKGKDPFRWAVLICIGHQCMSHPDYRRHHQIETPWPQMDAWLKNYERRVWISEHDGDVDYLALFAGKYQEYVLTEEERAAVN